MKSQADGDNGNNSSWRIVASIGAILAIAYGSLAFFLAEASPKATKLMGIILLLAIAVCVAGIVVKSKRYRISLLLAGVIGIVIAVVFIPIIRPKPPVPRSQCYSNLRTVQGAIERYEAESGTYPTCLDDMTHGEYQWPKNIPECSQGPEPYVWHDGDPPYITCPNNPDHTLEYIEHLERPGIPLNARILLVIVGLGIMVVGVKYSYQFNFLWCALGVLVGVPVVLLGVGVFGF